MLKINEKQVAKGEKSPSLKLDKTATAEGKNKITRGQKAQIWLTKDKGYSEKLKDEVLSDKKDTSTRMAEQNQNEETKKTSVKKPKEKRKKISSMFFVRGATDIGAPILKLENVNKSFGKFEALKGISFDIARGERVGLIGGNGAGKTTVSEIIAGINQPTSGKITYGFEFEESPKEAIGMQFQQSTYPSGLTVKDIISFARNLRKLEMTSKELKDLLEIFQMQDFYGRKVRSLSGGQRQKLNILLSIIHNPKLIILDELSTGLDISAREEIIEFTDNLLTKRNMSAIFISHHMAEIRALCSRVIILDNGVVRDIRSVEDIDKKYGSLEIYSKKLISESNKRLMEMERIKNRRAATVDGKAKKRKLAAKKLKAENNHKAQAETEKSNAAINKKKDKKNQGKVKDKKNQGKVKKGGVK